MAVSITTLFRDTKSGARVSFIKIVPKTKKEWLALRTLVVTATEVSYVLGLDKWPTTEHPRTGEKISKIKLMMQEKNYEKRMELLDVEDKDAWLSEYAESLEEFPHIDNAYMWTGRMLEPVVVNVTNDILGTDFKSFDGKDFYLDLELGLGATPDAYTNKMLLECKTGKPSVHLRSELIPQLKYVIQLQTQALCFEAGSINILTSMSNDMKQLTKVLNLKAASFAVARSKEIDDIIQSKVCEFWDCCRRDKLYRVDRKGCSVLELKLLGLIKKIY